jgi:DNA-binding response OmpR family regulator
MVNQSPNTSPTILLAEDDPIVARLLVDVLTAKGYCVRHATNGAEAEAMVGEVRPDLIVLDLMLPDTNGLVLCANLRRAPNVPIIICSGTKRKDDPVLGLKLGADDFVAKPFSIHELLARIEVALRRVAGRASAPAAATPSGQQVGSLVIDRAHFQVLLGGQPLHVTPTEYRLLCALADRPGEVVSHEELAKRVWGTYNRGVGRSLEVHMRRLRARLAAGAVPPPALVTLRGFGYKLVPEPASPSIAACSRGDPGPLASSSRPDQHVVAVAGQGPGSVLSLARSAHVGAD